jgi:hypothetical protein
MRNAYLPYKVAASSSEIKPASCHIPDAATAAAELSYGTAGSGSSQSFGGTSRSPVRSM